MRLGLLTAKAAPEHAHDGAALKQGQIQGYRRDGTAGKTDDQIAAVPGHAADRRLGVVAADRVVDHIHAAAPGERFNRCFQILLAVVDGLIGAEFPAHGQFLGRTGRRDHPGAHMPAQFHRRRADATGRAEHQQRLAGAQLRALLEGVVAGEVSDRHTRRLLEAETIGHRR